MNKLCVIFLILNGCITVPSAKFDAQWSFYEDPKGETLVCLHEDDVSKLHKILVECKK